MQASSFAYYFVLCYCYTKLSNKGPIIPPSFMVKERQIKVIFICLNAQFQYCKATDMIQIIYQQKQINAKSSWSC